MVTSETTTTSSLHAEKEVISPSSPISKKRRLSKKERKALKKKRKQNSNAVSTTEATATAKAKAKKAISKDASKEDQCNDGKSSHGANENYASSHVPIPVPKQPLPSLLKEHNSTSNNSTDPDESHEGGGAGQQRTLGNWFPNALLLKCPIHYTNTGALQVVSTADVILPNDELLETQQRNVPNPKASLVLFYQYNNKRDTSKPWTIHQLQILMTYLYQIGQHRWIGGRIRVAAEGVNATLSAVDRPNGLTAQQTLRHVALDLQQIYPHTFGQTDFKYMDDLPADRHFKELKIMPVQELVFYGFDTTTNTKSNEKDKKKKKDASLAIQGGIHLDANAYHEYLQRDNTVVIDVRNHYETILGRFDGQQQDHVSAVASSASPSDSKSSKRKKTTTKEGPSLKSDQGTNPRTDDRNKRKGAEYIDPLMRKSTDFQTWLSKDETKDKLKGKTVMMYCTGGIRCEKASVYLKQEMGDSVEEVYQLKGGVERYLKAFPDGGFWRGKNFVFDKREAVGIDNPAGDGGVVRKKSKKSTAAAKSSGSIESKCCVCDQPWDRYIGKKKCYTCGVPVLMCDKCMSLKPDKTPGMELKVRCPLCVKEKVTVPASEVEWTANGIKGSQQKGSADSVLKWGGGHASEKKMIRRAKRRPCQFGSECVRNNCFFWHPPSTTKK